MKRFLFVSMLVFSLVVFADMVNFYGEFSTTIYSFELVRKISNTAGYFVPCYLALDKEALGGGRYRQRRTEDKLNKTIVIVGQNLSTMADGHRITLKKGQVLYQIGVYSNQRGRSFEVYSFNRNEKWKKHLTQNAEKSTASTSASSTAVCPHCGKTIRLSR